MGKIYNRWQCNDKENLTVARFFILPSCPREVNDSKRRQCVLMDSLEVSGGESFYLFATCVVGKADSKSLRHQLLLSGCQKIGQYLESQIICQYLESTSQKLSKSMSPTLNILSSQTSSYFTVVSKFYVDKVTIYGGLQISERFDADKNVQYFLKWISKQAS